MFLLSTSDSKEFHSMSWSIVCLEASPVPPRPFFLVYSKCSIWFVIVPSVPSTLVHSCTYFFSPMFTQVHPCSHYCTLLFTVVICCLLFQSLVSLPLLFTLVHTVHSPAPTCSVLFTLVPLTSVVFILVHSRSLQITIVIRFHCFSL